MFDGGPRPVNNSSVEAMRRPSLRPPAPSQGSSSALAAEMAALNLRVSRLEAALEQQNKGLHDSGPRGTTLRLDDGRMRPQAPPAVVAPPAPAAPVVPESNVALDEIREHIEVMRHVVARLNGRVDAEVSERAEALETLRTEQYHLREAVHQLQREVASLARRLRGG